MKRVCLKDVAEAAGVSAVTASIVLNGGSTRSRARVGAARQEEIRRIAAELGYRASAAARILKCKELNDIGLLFFENAQNIREHVGFTDLNIQFTRTCRELGIRCQVDWFDSLHHPDELPGLLTDGLVGGLLIAGNPNGESERFLREQCRMPFVRIEEPGEYSVMFDPAPALREALEYLAATGHRRLGFVNGPARFQRYRHIRGIVASETARLGMESPQEFYYEAEPYEDFSVDAVLAERRLMDCGEPPDAVLVSSAVLGKAFVSLLQQRGLRVPLDVGVVCFEATDWDALKFVPRLTAVEYDYTEIAARAVRMLQELMKSGTVREPRLLVPERFTVRDTVIDRRSRKQ